MHKKSGFDLEDETQSLPRFEKIGKGQGGSKKARKQSYEGNADVQRWLSMQGINTTEALVKPQFHPTFLAGQRDADWILSSLTTFYEEDLITDVLHAVKSGKEASVYCCAAHPSTGLPYAAAKVYRPRMFRSLRNDAIYRLGRTQRDAEGQVVRQESSHQQDALKSAKGRASQVSTWIEYEFQTLRLLSAAGAAVPRPLAQLGNAVLMEYIGDLGEPAPLLREVRLRKEEAQPLFATIMENIELFLVHNRIHGDLSAYNILYWQGAVNIIDLAQAVDPAHGDSAFLLLLRDIERVYSYFARYGVVADPHELASELWRKHQGGL